MKALLESWLAGPGGGPAEISLAFEGWSPWWVFGAALLLVVLSWAAYRVGAPDLPPGRRRLLTALRAAFFVLLLLLLLRPVLLLTLNEPVRGRLLVLVDDSQSMSQTDKRIRPEDQRRQAIAENLVRASDPSAALPEPAPSPVSRTEMLRRISSNPRVALWDRIHESTNLEFFAYDKTLRPLGTIDETFPGDVPREVSRLLAGLRSEGRATATGDALRQLLDEARSRAAGGILIVSDGGANSGSPAVEAAALARESGIPVHVYATGITEPNDIMVREVTGAPGVFKKEFVEYTVKVRATGQAGKTAKLVLREGDRVVQEQDIPLAGTGEETFRIGYQPSEAGSFLITASIAPGPGEASADNNSATTRLRVLDDKLHVLYLEQEPRWDFRYLLATLERDPRLQVECLLFDGDPVKAGEEGRPFLTEFPASRADLVKNSVVILGDVNPVELGETRMNAIREWVADAGGAILFLAGPKNNPFRYGATPLGPLLPVETNPALREAEWKERSATPIPLVLTPAGELSPILRLSPDRTENRRLWKDFPGVRWTARVACARPGAQVLVEDSTNRTSDGLMPVIATMAYGQGAVLYFGLDETYRWRSRTGEKFYSAIWNQIIQQFAIDRKLASSPRIQIRPDRLEYPVGEPARLAGRIFDEEFRPLRDESVPATLRVRTHDGTELPPKSVRLLAKAGRPGEYELPVETGQEGTYTVTTALDPSAPVSFEVREPSVEMADTAMDESALRAIASLSGGSFFREESLEALPGLLKERRATLPVVRKFEPAYSAWWLFALLALLGTEWLLRRLWNLK